MIAWNRLKRLGPLSLLVAAVCLPLAARVIAGPRGAAIHVRWQSSVDEATRRTLESRFRLADGERLEGSTWRYDLTNPVTDNVRALVSDPSVADTHDIDRSIYAVSPTAVRTDRRQRFGDFGRTMVIVADRMAATFFIVAVWLVVFPVLKRSIVPPVLARIRRPLLVLLGFLQRGIPEIDAGTAGIFRIVFGLLLLAFFISRSVDASWLRATFDLEVEGSFHAAVLDWLRANPVVVDLLTPWLLVTGIAFTAGLFTRTTYACFAAGVLLWAFVRVSLDSTHPNSTLVLTVFALLPSKWGDSWSIDSWRRGGIRERATSKRYGYSVWVPGLVFGIGYAAAAWAKLVQGPQWVLNGTVKYHFITDSVIAPFNWGLQLANHPRLAIVASLFAVVTEAVVITAAFQRSERYRMFMGLAGFGLLSGFWVFMGHFWPGWWMLLLGFLPWRRISIVLARRQSQASDSSVIPVGTPWRTQATAFQLALIAGVLGQQVVFSTLRIERAPMFSYYPMYSGTYASPAAYEASRLPRYRIVATTDKGLVQLRCSPHERFVRDFDAAVAGSSDARASVWRSLGGCVENLRAVKSVTLEGEINTFDWQQLTFTSRAATTLGPLPAQ